MKEYLKKRTSWSVGVHQRSGLEEDLGIMIIGDMNAHIWELDGCENENGRRMKESMTDLGL